MAEFKQGDKVKWKSHGGEAIVLEPEDLRSRIVARARELAKELGVERMRVKV